MEYKYFEFNDPNLKAFPKRSAWSRRDKFLYNILTLIIPKSNPDFDMLYSEVKKWQIEYDIKQNWISREIGFDNFNQPFVIAPYKKNRGLWVDSDLILEDIYKLNVIDISSEEFNTNWNIFKFN